MAAPKGNKFALGNSGTQKKWSTTEELQEAIDGYFYHCDNRKVQVYSKTAQDVIEMVRQVPYTIEGLCDTLECDRDTLLNYEKKEGYEEYFGIVKRAKLKIQRNKLERGLEGDSNPVVTIFDLKNNHGYKDKVEQETTNINYNAEVSKEEAKNISDALEDEV